MHEVFETFNAQHDEIVEVDSVNDFKMIEQVTEDEELQTHIKSRKCELKHDCYFKELAQQEAQISSFFVVRVHGSLR